MKARTKHSWEHNSYTAWPRAGLKVGQSAGSLFTRAVAIGISGIAFALILFSATGATLVAAFSLSSLPDTLTSGAVKLNASKLLDAQMPQTTTIMARDGSVLAQINDVHLGTRLSVPLAEISPDLVHATVAT